MYRQYDLEQEEVEEVDSKNMDGMHGEMKHDGMENNGMQGTWMMPPCGMQHMNCPGMHCGNMQNNGMNVNVNGRPMICYPMMHENQMRTLEENTENTENTDMYRYPMGMNYYRPRPNFNHRPMFHRPNPFNFYYGFYPPYYHNDYDEDEDWY